MTMDRIILPGVTDETNDLLNHLLSQLKATQPRNLKRAAYYDGHRRLNQVTHVVPRAYYQLGLVLGWSAKAVDLLARRCHLEGFVWPDGDLEALGAQILWDQNYMGSEADSGITASLLHGPAFLINTIGAEGEPASLIHVKDALDATGDWNPRTRSLDNLLSITKRSNRGAPSSLVLYLDGVTITAEKDPTAAGGWEVDWSEHPWGVPAEVLPYRPQVRRPYGSSRITRPCMSLQDQATRELVRLEGHMDVFSFPEMLMLGADMSVFRNDDGSQMEAWKVMLGRWKGIPDDEDALNPRVDVKQFPAASPDPHLAALNTFAKLFARESSLPDTALAITDVANPTSAESYDASQYELIAEAEGATDDWSPAFRKSFTRGLAIQNGLTEVPPEWASIEARWRDPRYQSRAAVADAGMKQLTAAPDLAGTEVGLELLGLSDHQIKRVMADRRRGEGQQALAFLRQAAALPTQETPGTASEAAPQAAEVPQL